MQTQLEKTRLGIHIYGVVQGVGLRPFIYNLAKRYTLSGFVRNDNGTVELELQGPKAAIEKFLEELRCAAPPLARIAEIKSQTLLARDCDGFEILESSCSDANTGRFIPADSATCEQCLAELFSPSDRRFRYPFISCVDCGPRFSIIKALPYDRKTTSMSAFELCRHCLEEYGDSDNRRFRAEANACFECGPQLSLRVAGTETATGLEALDRAVEYLRRGHIIAIKGLGGFQLICDAENVKAIARLRKAKRRKKKAFALMVADYSTLAKHCDVSEKEAELLQSSRRPIVILDRKPECSLPADIAPGTDRLAVMLPYTPVHHLLLRDFGKPVIATSANLQDEPIATNLDEALAVLSSLTDVILDHNREIYSRCDDSLLQVIEAKESVLRRARGMAPMAIDLPADLSGEVLSFGADLKNTFCIMSKQQAYLSQHIGNLENPETNDFYLNTIAKHLDLFSTQPAIVASDLHPDYHSRRAAEKFAQDRSLPIVHVQHHHAHIVACMAEHGISEPVIGVAFDGLGYGPDNTIWGGEFLLSTFSSFERLAHLEPVKMPGATKAILEPWRMALSYIYSSGTDCLFAAYQKQLAERFGAATIATVKQQIDRKLNSPLTSSCGRLFDAVSAVLGICQTIDYEGQAAIELESIAWSYFGKRDLLGSEIEVMEPYRFELKGKQQAISLAAASILRAAYQDLQNGFPCNHIAARFHYTLALMVMETCKALRVSTGINVVCLAGGVFQNRLLLALVGILLEKNGFQWYFPERVPANDGGIALGQAIVAASQLVENKRIF